MTTRTRMIGLAVAAALLIAFASSEPFADTVETFQPGTQGDTYAAEALGPPAGEGLFAGGEDVTTLGAGGVLTLEFSSPLFDGPGADLIVQENPFFVASSSQTAFCEVVTVGVSTNGSDFAVFPTAYLGPAIQVGPFDGVRPEWYVGYAGVLPVTADPAEGVDPVDVVRGGGDAFDLAALTSHPLVQSGQVDLQFIRYVRMVDVDSGDDLDDEGNLVFDAGLDEVASADIDAVTALNHASQLDPGRPEVELTLSPGGFLTLRLYDVETLDDIIPGITASVNGVEISFWTIFPLFVPVVLSPDEAVLLLGPIPQGAYQAILKVSAKDGAGRVSGDVVHIR